MTVTNDINKRWANLVRRMRGEAASVLENNRQRGCAIITAHVLVDSDGKPMVWVVPEGKRVEPTRDAARILMTLSQSLGDLG